MNPLYSPLFSLGRSSWNCAKCRICLPRYGYNPTTSIQPTPSTGPQPYPSTRAPISTYRRYSSRNSNGKNRSYSGKGDSRNGTKKNLLYASAGASTATVAALAFTDEIKFGYESAERTGRVAAGLGICINDYLTTLKKKDEMEDREEGSKLLKECHKRCAVRTLHVLEKNGGIFIKLGQHLSAMGYLLPTEWTTTFVPLQDRCPVSSFESLQQMFRNDFDQEIMEYFSEFSPEPIGAASLAQVHLATVRETGQRVAVKIQHPELAQWAPLDLSLTKFTFSTLKRFFPEYDLSWLSDEMEISLPIELDFEREAENANRTKAHFSHIPELPLVVPDVIWAKPRILVMACEVGHRLDDLEYIDANGIDRDEVSATLSRIFNEMIFSPGAPLHCDPHGGNIAIRKNNRRRGANFDVILYDHGLYRDIPLELRRSYAKMWLAVIDGDMDRMRKYAKEVAGITDDKFELFASAITGRDFTIVRGDSNVSITAPKTSDEKENITGALQDGLLSELVQMLGQVPRIILLILKTNDLTRALDESLQTRQGPSRTFLILARYCSKTVLLEQVEEIKEMGSLFWPPNTLKLAAAYIGFLRVECKLELFELWLVVKRLVGIQGMDFATPGL
ncbi:uncharacterized protein MKZ38_009422 [Zalerion maritima]|uniref:ABC1 atypical kinase-like domain-containing protein n=1 Tax=Zalerion maritima TaxID=339359 RepID=A0AAD5RGE4_9PEZI|nr:uncharacterized protein MKZ38_009422 [Zalerion maritima]